ncbi:hypothetical protein [Caballeronia sp. ATUFL_M1_KS5A]|uniref:hypothetical protein n=1 Tax=Caballeronia sp. ATUFL_M1_KS5A TaxID=2921778 RepID=UPI002027D6E5|nr:hypothetical protein [Caballeronia sp. ATUFL_M1_KS5A]
MLIVGIDPGVKGALAFLGADGALKVHDMPIRQAMRTGKVKNEVDPVGLQKLVRSGVPADQTALVVMEDLNTFAGGSVQTMGSLEATKAVIRTVMELNRLDVAFISPRVWQSFFGIKRTQSSDTKEQSLKIARELYGRDHCPLQKHDGRADAILIARYAQRNLV